MNLKIIKKSKSLNRIVTCINGNILYATMLTGSQQYRFYVQQC